MQKNMAFCVPIGRVRFARYCGKMYSRHASFPYGGLKAVELYFSVKLLITSVYHLHKKSELAGENPKFGH